MLSLKKQIKMEEQAIADSVIPDVDSGSDDSGTAKPYFQLEKTNATDPVVETALSDTREDVSQAVGSPVDDTAYEQVAQVVEEVSQSLGSTRDDTNISSTMEDMQVSATMETIPMKSNIPDLQKTSAFHKMFSKKRKLIGDDASKNTSDIVSVKAPRTSKKRQKPVMANKKALIILQSNQMRVKLESAMLVFCVTNKM
jgi:hypothetical protein